MAYLCVIPARGGSKRIPKKNIRLFSGKPIIAWSILSAKESNCFTDIIVSTDDPEIASVAIEYGAKVPFLRPSSLSNDVAGTRQVIQHAIEWFLQRGQIFNAVCCLYATSPFTSSSDLCSGLELLNQSVPLKFVFPVTTYVYPIMRSLRLDSEGHSSVIDSAAARSRSQQLEEFYHDAGQFYWAHPSTWCRDINILDSGYPLIIPRWRVQDIDSEEDWIRAEFMYDAIKESMASD